jgi:hypothetical protein
MPEENKDANDLAENSSTSAAVENENTESSEKTQAEANSAQTSEKEDSLPFHQHPRFKELIEEKNELRGQLSHMERLLNEKLNSQTQSDPLEGARAKLKGLGVDDKAAAELLDAVRIVADNRVGNLEKANVQQQIDSWVTDFSRSHKDYEELEPQMYEVFSALQPRTQQLIASDPMGIQLLYDHVKQQGSEQSAKKAYQDGVKAGYKNKQEKSSVSPTTGGSTNPPGELTRKSIDEMSIEEYKKRRKEIWAAMSKLKDGD